jgi:hypothetical protein
MTLTDPGASEWLVIFSTSFGYGTLAVIGISTFSIYNAGVRDDDSERLQAHGASIDNGNYYGFTHEQLTVAGATDDIDLRWKGSAADSRTAHERTLVAVREATAAFVKPPPGYIGREAPRRAASW